MAVGFGFGIIRANVPNTLSYFLFDIGLIGMYAAVWSRPLTPVQRYKSRQLLSWLAILVALPLVFFLVPRQDLLVQLVGLRTAIFFLPFMLIGAMMEGAQYYQLALGISVLNLVALAFAVAELVFGLEAFFPHNAVTHIMYNMHLEYLNHAAAKEAFRIPSCFSDSAHYGMTMTLSLPLLIGASVQRHRKRWARYLLIAGLGAALSGVFISASRTQALILTGIILFSLFSGRLGPRFMLGWLALLLGLGILVAHSPRLQRFRTLDAQFVGERASMSANSRFFTLVADYPLGIGLGAGGSVLPEFLQARIGHAPNLENEYSRILLEEGIPGLLTWIAFLFWVLFRKPVKPWEEWVLARKLAWFTCLLYFATAWTGIGLLVSIPGSALLFLMTGWIVAAQPSGVMLAHGTPDEWRHQIYQSRLRYELQA